MGFVCVWKVRAPGLLSIRVDLAALKNSIKCRILKIPVRAYSALARIYEDMRNLAPFRPGPKLPVCSISKVCHTIDRTECVPCMQLCAYLIYVLCVRI